VDLSSPLRSIAPGLDSAVLEVLAGTESPLSASQIARLARRGTRPGQLPVLNRLVEHGLVHAEPANQGHLYRLNREHVLADAVLSATRARSGFLARLTHAVEALHPEPVSVALFGSFARGEGRPQSDVDLLLVVPSDAVLDDDWALQLQHLADRVMSWTGNRLEHVVLTEQRLRKAARAGEPVVRSWLDEAHVLHGRRLDALVASAAPRSRGRH
jgi:predicted nucleotidyltransferase